MNKIGRIVVIDDEQHICEVIRLYLEHAGFESLILHSGMKAAETVQEQRPDLILMDVMLPELSGFDVCQQIRSLAHETKNTPIIMLTAKGEAMDKLRGFNLGVDDYIVKPFDPNELIARIKAVLRRTRTSLAPVKEAEPSNPSRLLQFGTLVIDIEQYKVSVDDVRIDLTPKEVELLYFLAMNPNRVFSREDLLGRVWKFDFSGGTRTVDAHIKNLRKKLGFQQNATQNWGIQTLWGVGYSFEVRQS